MRHNPASASASPRSDQTARLERAFKPPRRAPHLLRLLAGRRNILVTTHEHPDPDALAAAIGLSQFLEATLPDADATVSFKGSIGGGLNSIFAHYSGRHTEVWDPASLKDYDAVVLVDCQPPFSNSPLPEDIAPLAVIDHHPHVRGRDFRAPFCDIRTTVGASCSIVYSYFHEMQIAVSSDVAALMLFGIESDLAGIAGQPSKLDHYALSNLILVADIRAYHAIRYVDLPRSYFVAYQHALSSAMLYGPVLISHLGEVDSPEQPAVLADFLLRCEGADWALVTAVHESSLLLSLRTLSTAIPAGKVMRRLVRSLGEGGGHPTKGGGMLPLRTGTANEVQCLLATSRRRLLRSLHISVKQPVPLVPPELRAPAASR